ncbi:DUF167 domain-containing protein [Massilia sp. W12]|uniref:DUF167 domain-containing protein n=1 Tax=Massilia sp. W12 TaxID=3126507 RepID=UPI0030D10556
MHGKHLRLAVQVAPNAKKSEVMEVLPDALKIRLQAPPIDGRANQELIRFLSEQLRLPKSAIQITHGAAARRKLLEIVRTPPDPAWLADCLGLPPP